jgi:hypothetical protein
MDMQRSRGWTRMIAIALPLLVMQAATAQTFSSGSTGADGAYDATANDTKPGGVYNYTTYRVGPGVTVTYNRGPDNSPVVILVSGDVLVDGSITANGANGTPGTGVTPALGANGGPGGFNGGGGGLETPGFPRIFGAPGQGPGGGAPGPVLNGPAAQPGVYGAPDLFVGLVPLFGGSGGGGGYPGGHGGGGPAAGGGGGGGGGAILIASSTQITVNGAIRANGGNAWTDAQNGHSHSGAGSGGAIRLVAPTIIGGVNSQLQALRGTGSALGGPGRIRIEAFARNFNGLSNPTAVTAEAPGPVSPAGNPALANVPTLAIARVGTTDVPTTPTASYSLPDITLPPGTGQQVPVRVDATNTPVGAPTEIIVRLLARGTDPAVLVAAANHTGTFASSSATADVNLVAGEVTVLQAHAAMLLTGQVASLFPLIDGEPVERVALAATLGAASTLSLVTKSGKERRVDELPLEDQMRVARAWDAIKAMRTE